MILYLHASSLVKRYVDEWGSDEVARATETATLVGTVAITRVEVSAAMAKAVRLNILTRKEASRGLRAFRQEWADFVQLQVTDLLISRADALAWEHDLRGRGYDAVQLAAASLWQEMLSDEVTLSTFDQRLWKTAGEAGLAVHPHDLPGLLSNWSGQG
jgi:predicted nucleic acid-binding protein